MYVYLVFTARVNVIPSIDFVTSTLFRYIILESTINLQIDYISL